MALHRITQNLPTHGCGSIDRILDGRKPSMLQFGTYKLAAFINRSLYALESIQTGLGFSSRQGHIAHR